MMIIVFYEDMNASPLKHVLILSYSRAFACRMNACYLQAAKVVLNLGFALDLGGGIGCYRQQLCRAEAHRNVGTLPASAVNGNLPDFLDTFVIAKHRSRRRGHIQNESHPGLVVLHGVVPTINVLL